MRSLLPRRVGRDAGTLARPSRAILLALVSTAFFRATPAPEPTEDAPASLKAAYTRASQEVLCYCGCARQTVYDCTCGVAFDLRDQFEKRLAAGETPEAVVASYIAAHGEASRNVPPKSGINLVAWFGPGAAILAAGGVTVVLILVWSRRGAKAAPAAVEPTLGDEEAVRRRLERELKEYDA